MAMDAALKDVLLRGRHVKSGARSPILSQPLGPLRGGEDDDDDWEDFISRSSVEELSAPSSPLPPRWEADHSHAGGSGGGSGGSGGNGDSAPDVAGDPVDTVPDLITRFLSLGVCLLLGSVAGYVITRIWPGFLFLPDDDDATFDAWRRKRYRLRRCA